jgi:hypothetical protein
MEPVEEMRSIFSQRRDTRETELIDSEFCGLRLDPRRKCYHAFIIG